MIQNGTNQQKNILRGKKDKMKFEKTDVWGFEHAIRGMRNPLESWDRSDSGKCSDTYCHNCVARDSNCNIDDDDFVICKNDFELMRKLIKAGAEHRKFLRQIFVSVDITAPLFWWKEFDTYKIGTTANSCSTMHKLASTPITMDCFEFNKLSDSNPMAEIIKRHRLSTIDYLERLRKSYHEITNEDIKNEIWKTLIEDLPESWLQKRTITMNYENLCNMYQQRKSHKLTEWSKDFIQWWESLPYFKELFND